MYITTTTTIIIIIIIIIIISRIMLVMKETCAIMILNISFIQIAKLTHSISVFTEGILMMKTTLVGIIKVCKLSKQLYIIMDLSLVL